MTGSESESGGERNAASIAARVSEAAASVGAHIVLGAGDQHILDAVAGHLPGPLRPVTTIAAGPVPTDSDDRLSARIGAALDGITGEAIGAVGNLVASSAAGAAYGIDAVAEQLAEQQVAVLLVAADLARDGDGASYRIGRRPTEFIVGDPDVGAEVPLKERAGLGRAAPGRDHRAAAGPLRPAVRPSPWPPCSAADRLTTARSGCPAASSVSWTAASSPVPRTPQDVARIRPVGRCGGVIANLSICGMSTPVLAGKEVRTRRTVRPYLLGAEDLPDGTRTSSPVSADTGPSPASASSFGVAGPGHVAGQVHRAVSTYGLSPIPAASSPMTSARPRPTPRSRLC